MKEETKSSAKLALWCIIGAVVGAIIYGFLSGGLVLGSTLIHTGESMTEKAVIVVGGHIANLTNIENAIDADNIVNGDGVSWFRHVLKQDVDAAIKHPQMPSCFGIRILGVPVSNKPKDTAAILIITGKSPARQGARKGLTV